MTTSLKMAVIGSLLCGGFLHFSLAEERIQDLGTTSIVAEKPTTSILENLREEDALKDEKLERKTSTTLAETIENEPDVAVRSMGPAPTRPVIKGLSGSHINLVEDGAASCDMSGTSPDHAVASEVLSVRKIRILRGPNILAQSFSAAGGVIQVERQDIPFGSELFHGYLVGYAESGQPGFATVAGSNLSVSGISFKGELSTRRMGDLKTPEGNLDNTGIQNKGFAFGTAYAIGRFRFGASYRSFGLDYGIPGGFIGGHPNGVDIELYKRDWTFRGFYLPMKNVHDTLNVVYRVNQYHHKEFESKNVVGAEFAVNQENLRLEKFIAENGPFFGIRIGGELEKRSIEMGGYVFTPPTKSYAISAFSVANLKGWKGLEITLSARVGGAFFRPEKSVVASEESIVSRDFLLWSASAEFSQRILPGKFATLDIFRTSRAPTIEELYNQGPHLAAYTYEKGSSTLDGENGYGSELEFRSYGENVNWRASVYGTYFINHLAPRATGDTNWSQLLPIYQVRGDEAVLCGASVSFEKSSETGLYAAAGGSLVRGFYRNENWSDMPQIPPILFHCEIAYLWKSLRGSLTGRFALPQNHVDIYEERTPGYACFGFSLEWRGSGTLARYSIILSGENLSDADVRNHLSRLKSVMPEKGRNFGLKFGIEF